MVATLSSCPFRSTVAACDESAPDEPRQSASASRIIVRVDSSGTTPESAAPEGSVQLQFAASEISPLFAAPVQAAATGAEARTGPAVSSPLPELA